LHQASDLSVALTGIPVGVVANLSGSDAPCVLRRTKARAECESWILPILIV
jgi:hypothetical protein